MSKLTNLSFSKHGAETEQRFKALVDKYLGDKSNIQRDLDDGAVILIYKKTTNCGGLKYGINIYDDRIGYCFTLRSAELAEEYIRDEKRHGVKIALRTTSFPEVISALDSRDLDTLEKFLADHLGA